MRLLSLYISVSTYFRWKDALRAVLGKKEFWMFGRKPLGMLCCKLRHFSIDGFIWLFLLLGFTFLCFVFRNWIRKATVQSLLRSWRDRSFSTRRTTTSSTWRRYPKDTAALKGPGFTVPLEAARRSCKACVGAIKTILIQKSILLFHISKKQSNQATSLKYAKIYVS